MLNFGTDPSRRDFLRRVASFGITVAAIPLGGRVFGAERPKLPGTAVAFPGPWQFMVPKGGIILVSDQLAQNL
jgi:hypothetical protein